NTFTYTFAAGGADNASFTISGSTLATAAGFDFETKSSYSVLITSTDQSGLSVTKTLTITVIDVTDNAAPTDINLTLSSVAENKPSGILVGTLSTTDPD